MSKTKKSRADKIAEVQSKVVVVTDWANADLDTRCAIVLTGDSSAENITTSYNGTHAMLVSALATALRSEDALRTIVLQAVETYHALNDAAQIINKYSGDA